jgi:hypothetical protein
MDVPLTKRDALAATFLFARTGGAATVDARQAVRALSDQPPIDRTRVRLIPLPKNLTARVERSVVPVLLAISTLGAAANRASAAVTLGASQVAANRSEILAGIPATVRLGQPSAFTLRVRQGQSEEHPARAIVQLSLPIAAFGPELAAKLRQARGPIEVRAMRPWGTDGGGSTVLAHLKAGALVLAIPEVDPAAWHLLRPVLGLRLPSGEEVVLNVEAPRITVDWTPFCQNEARTMRSAALASLRAVEARREKGQGPHIEALRRQIRLADRQLTHPDPTWRQIISGPTR